MKTSIPKADTLNQKWYLIDAQDKVLGDVATVVANKLRGKDKPLFTPHLDCGDYVVIVNAGLVKLTGQKEDKKLYHSHSGFPGGYKEKPAKQIRSEKPTKLIELAVYGMLPKNKLRKHFMRKLKLYAGDAHPHEAQLPENLEI